MKATVCILAATIFWIGCVSISPYQYRNYQIGRVDSCVVGDPLIYVQNGLRSHNMGNPDTLGFFFGFESELLYTGISGSTVYLTHREYQTNVSGVYIRPAFSLQVQYDLSLSRLVAFKNYSLEIIEANPRMIKYRVLSDHDNASQDKMMTSMASDTTQFYSKESFYETPVMIPPGSRKMTKFVMMNGFTGQAYLSGESSTRYLFAMQQRDTSYSTIPKRAIRLIEELK